MRFNDKELLTRRHSLTYLIMHSSQEENVTSHVIASSQKHKQQEGSHSCVFQRSHMCTWLRITLVQALWCSAIAQTVGLWFAYWKDIGWTANSLVSSCQWEVLVGPQKVEVLRGGTRKPGSSTYEYRTLPFQWAAAPCTAEPDGGQPATQVVFIYSTSTLNAHAPHRM